MDDVIFEEFKGTGNMEVFLDRNLSEKRLFPAIDINKSGTRRDDLLLTPEELNIENLIRKNLSRLSTQDMTERILQKMMTTKNNKEFIEQIENTLK